MSAIFNSAGANETPVRIRRSHPMPTDAAPPEPNRAVVPFTLPGWDHRMRGFHCGAEVDVFALVTERYLIFIDTSATPEQAAAVAEAMRAELAGRQPLV